MYKNILTGISLSILSLPTWANKKTEIKITSEINEPVHVGVFSGFCSKLKTNNLKVPIDFTAIETNACKYTIDQTLDPQKPEEVLNAFQPGRITLTLVAIQDNGARVTCPIDEKYETIFIGPGDKSDLVCSGLTAEDKKTAALAKAQAEAPQEEEVKPAAKNLSQEEDFEETFDEPLTEDPNDLAEDPMTEIS